MPAWCRPPGPCFRPRMPNGRSWTKAGTESCPPCHPMYASSFFAWPHPLPGNRVHHSHSLSTGSPAPGAQAQKVIGRTETGVAVQAQHLLAAPCGKTGTATPRHRGLEMPVFSGSRCNATVKGWCLSSRLLGQPWGDRPSSSSCRDSIRIGPHRKTAYKNEGVTGLSCMDSLIRVLQGPVDQVTELLLFRWSLERLLGQWQQLFEQAMLAQRRKRLHRMTTPWNSLSISSNSLAGGTSDSR